MGKIDLFCEYMFEMCVLWKMHYGQGNSDFPYPRYDFRAGGSSDCSATIGKALERAGFEGATPTWWTGTMSEILTAHGWERVPANGKPIRGDILLNDWHHVGMWDGEYVLEFGGDPNYGYVTRHGYYDYPWDCYLRYRGDENMDYAKAQLWTPYSGNDHQIFELKKHPDGCYTVYNETYDKCLAYAGGKTAPNTQVLFWTPTDSDDQRWYVNRVRGVLTTYLELIPKNDRTKRVTTVGYGTVGDGLVLQSIYNSDYGKWTVRPVKMKNGEGTCMLINRAEMLALDGDF